MSCHVPIGAFTALPELWCVADKFAGSEWGKKEQEMLTPPPVPRGGGHPCASPAGWQAGVGTGTPMCPAHSQAVPQLLCVIWRPQGLEALLQGGHCHEKGDRR